MRGRRFILLTMALRDLKSLGYIVLQSMCPGFGKNVYRVWKLGDRENMTLIQTRSYDPKEFRNLVGIMIDDLRRADRLFVWFEKELVAYLIPTKFLCNILDSQIEAGKARYSTGGSQWRVDFHIGENTLSPQGARGIRYPILQYRIDLPPASRESTGPGTS